MTNIKTYIIAFIRKIFIRTSNGLKLCQKISQRQVVVFGDGINDLEMFEVADECYAMSNAEPELKAAATKIIESNDNDGVARWLAENTLNF